MLLILFAGSGCAALIYEVVWFQFLQLVIGSSAISLGVLLGTYMAGLCLGSIALPRVISGRQQPLRVFAMLELGIGVLGLAIRFGMPYASGLYIAGMGYGLSGFLPRTILSAMCLLPPTLLMGASLPAIARSIETTPKGVSWLGFLYGGNIAGAVFGCLLAGFYLLRIHDLAVATYVAAGTNFAVAAIGLMLAWGDHHRPQEDQAGQDTASADRGSPSIYVAIAISGLCALGAEVVWTRLLSFTLGATVYTFSIILAVFLTGLGIGSGIASLLRGPQRARSALGCCQLLLAPAIAWTAWVLADSFPVFSGEPVHFAGVDFGGPWLRFLVDLLRCGWAIFPATFLWGASFPLALAAAARPGQDAGKLAGRIYAANTLGGIAGALAFSLFLIPGWGTQRSEQILIGLSALAGLIVLAPLLLQSGRTALQGEKSKSTAGYSLALGLATVIAIMLVQRLPKVPWEVLAYGRFAKRADVVENAGTPLYVGEGINSSIAISLHEAGVRYFHVAGKVEATTDGVDMRLQRMLGHIPALVHPAPRSVLVVGFGAGVTAGTFTLYPDIRRIVICEIEPLIPPATSRFFGPENYDVLHDPRTQMVYDDARHFILTTGERFDIITSDPIHPWVKGSSTLYSQEYFELVKRHLNPGGFVTQWVPLYQSDAETVKSEIATFFRVFPNGTIWGNDVDGEGYDVVLVGQAAPAKIDLDQIQARLDRPGYGAIVKSLEDVGFKQANDVFAKYAGRGRDLAPWFAGAQINRDLNLRLQYLAGMSVDSDDAGFIYSEMLRYREVPEDLFAGSESRVDAVKRAIELSDTVDPEE